MSAKHLHIVSFDVPFPPSYGGVIDVFYKARALKELGVNIRLHCFKYGRDESDALLSVADHVKYYPRRTETRLLFSAVPYIIASRTSEELLENISADNAPVLFEGLHCCAYLGHPLLAGKKKIVRTHNIEHDYYRSLADVEKHLFRRMYFRREAAKLQKFEKKLSIADAVLAISPADAMSLSMRYKNVHHVMAFHPYEEVAVGQTTADFALYHGNLEVGENNLAALFLVKEVFNDLGVPLVIAGNNPSDELVAAVKRSKNIRLEANIPTEKIDALISAARINVLPTFQATGIKLKLLAALFRGKHCIVNSPMIANTGLESLCTVADSAFAMKSAVKRMYDAPFGISEVEKRKQVLGERFSNRKNAEKILALI
ncbi:MAG TPA: glycosyltransferase family 1 protein [Bacteroidia bacterium]|nr:glycosyltransferase family 1 protein [Bacteroidia bacterium]